MEKEKYTSPLLEGALHTRVVVVEKNNCVIRGTLAEYGRYRLQLTDATIKHRQQVTVPWVIVERSAVAHIHPEAEIE